MISIHDQPHTYAHGCLAACPAPDAAGKGRTIAARILAAHSRSEQPDFLRVRFDALASHDITYVGIIQTARASGMQSFPMPYVLTNCHNSLCAVGGTINEDDHIFGLSAARKYGGVYVPAHQAVIHQYMREMMARCGGMILGSDSHTRYGALGCMGVGEGGPELVKQLLNQTWDLKAPQVLAVELTGAPRPGVGPQDVALALIRATFESGFAKNKVLEFIGEGVGNLSVEYRMGIDVMTTETTCLSSVWRTDDAVREFLRLHGREDDYRPLEPEEGATYDGLIRIRLDAVRPMIALPFHPSNALPIDEFLDDPLPALRQVDELARGMMKRGTPPSLTAKLRRDGLYVDQGVIAGCSGGLFENLTEAADILAGHSVGSDAFALSIYPASQPQMSALMKDGALLDLMSAGASIRSAFCGPCFGAGDVPANGALSIRHSTRNFPNREGAKPNEGQMAYVALMDARSIAATARNGGRLTAATDIACPKGVHKYVFDPAIYRNRVYDGRGRARAEESLIFGPNIADWPEMIALPKNLLLRVASAITDPVTTTDELIPSGETSSYRSNPMRLAEFTLSRKDPGYVGRAKAVKAAEDARRRGEPDEALRALYEAAGLLQPDADLRQLMRETGVGSLVFALRPGDGSAREQAASCQRVLGGCANVAGEYATKRYRSNVVNWGMLPLVADDASANPLAEGDLLYLPDIRAAVASGAECVRAIVIRDGAQSERTLRLPGLTQDERDVLLAGCLINYYKLRIEN